MPRPARGCGIRRLAPWARRRRRSCWTASSTSSSARVAACSCSCLTDSVLIPRRVTFTLLAAGLAIALGRAGAFVPLWARSADLPPKLTDREFWDLSELVSEANGEFQSDNFLSNERGYQAVIPELL